MVSMESTPEPRRDREIYPNAPLKLVAAEVRYPLSPRLAKLEPDALLERLGDLVPLAEEDQPLMQVMVGPAGVEPPASTPLGSRRLRLLSKARHLAVTITGTNTIIETTTYERFEVFQEVVGRVFDALEKLGPPVGIERLGLRYIDEIRVAEVSESPGDWQEYVDSSLLAATDASAGALADMGQHPEVWQGLIQFSGREGRGLHLRYGAGLGTVVNPNGPLRFPGGTDERPAFIIDLDSFWGPAELSDFSVPSLVKECEGLHEPLSRLFERIITDRLRNEVLRTGKED